MTHARVVSPWWQRLVSHVRDRLHLWSGCECVIVSTDEGIGGQCVTCGRIYGWMTSEELRRLSR